MTGQDRLTIGMYSFDCRDAAALAWFWSRMLERPVDQGARRVADAEAGVPLARISEIMSADPEHFARAVADIDQPLAREIAELEQRRRRVAELTAGERLFLRPASPSISTTCGPSASAAGR
jgi:hypothetical protein